MEVLPLVEQAAVPVLHVFLAASVGIGLALLGVLDEAARKSLAKLSVWLFIPCLTFVKLADAVSAQSLLQWWFFPLNVLLNHAIGGIVGGLVALCCRVRNPALFRLVVCAVSAGNMGNLPLVVLVAVCEADRERALFGSECEKRGVAYICLGMWAAQTVQFSVINRLLSKPAHFEPVDKEEPAEDISAAQAPYVGKEVGSVVVGIPAEAASHSSCQEMNAKDAEGPLKDPRLKPGRRTVVAARACRAVGQMFAKWVQPPVVASWAAIAVGTCQPVKALLFGDAAPLGAVRSVMDYFGRPFLAAAMLVLGGSLVRGPGAGSASLGKRTIAAVTLGRLAVVPAIGCMVVRCIAYTGVLPDDPIFIFVCVLQHGTPGAIALSTLCTLNGIGVEEVGTLLFWQYLLVLPFLSLTLMFAFSLVS